MIKKYSFLILLLFFCCSICGKKTKGQLFCDVSMLPKRTNCSTQSLLELSSFIKVGSTFTFKGIGYLDKLSMPLKVKKVNLKVTFNDNNTITFTDSKGKKTIKVYTVWAESRSFSGGSQNFGILYRVFFNLDDGTTCEMYRQAPNSNLGRNEYGIQYKGDEFRYYSGSFEVNYLMPFNY